MQTIKKIKFYGYFFQNRPVILYTALFIVALIPRFLGITFHSLYYDETSTALMVSQPSISVMLKALNAIEGTPPLFYIIEKIFVDSTGVMNDFTLRFLPMIFGTFSCILMFYLIKKISSVRNALLTFILLAFSNFFIYLSDEARCYSLFGFLVLFNLVLIVEWWNRPTVLKETLILITIFFLAQVHYYSIFWISSLLLSGIFFLPEKKKYFRFYILLFVTIIISYGLIIPLFLNQSQHEIGAIRTNLTNNWLAGIVFSPVKVILHAYLYKIYSIKELSPRDLFGIIPVVLMIASSLVIFVQRIIKNKVNILEQFIFFTCAGAFTMHCLIGSLVATVHPRYMAHILVLLFALIVLQTDKIRSLQVTFFIALLSLNIWANYNFFNKSIYYIEPYREIAEDLRQYDAILKTDNPPILSDFLNCHSLSFYMKEKPHTFFFVPSYFNIDDKYATYDMKFFGNTFYTDLYKNDFYSICDTITIKEIFEKNKTGFFVLRQKSLNEPCEYLQKLTGDIITFSTLKTYRTNQGDISLLFWKINKSMR